MSRPRKSHIDQLEKLIREAWRTLVSLPAQGCRPATYRSAMPEIVRERWDFNSATERWAENKRPGPDPDAITRLDNVMLWIAAAPLTAHQRGLIWEKAKGRKYTDLAYQAGCHERTIRRHHFNALAEVCATAIALKRKSPPARSVCRQPDTMVA